VRSRAAESLVVAGRGGGGLSDVAGLYIQKLALLLGVAAPLRRREVAEKFGVKPARFALLFGPPGTGKTFLMERLGRALGLSFAAVSGSSFFGRWLGESEERLRTAIATARMNGGILFIDEVDALLPNRSLVREGEGTAARVVNVFLREVSEMKPGEAVIVGATNFLTRIDEAARSRAEMIIPFPPPGQAERADIIRVQARLQGVRLAPDFNAAEIAEKTANFSSRQLRNLVSLAAKLALMERLGGGGGDAVGQRHFLMALREVRPDLTPRQIRMFMSEMQLHSRGLPTTDPGEAKKMFKAIAPQIL